MRMCLCECVESDMKRIFVNVGTALFAVEYVKESIIIYDCGCSSSNSTTRIDNIIDKLFPSEPKMKIDAVFISHYDRDHINGIHHLLKRCQVEKLILPMLPEATLLYMLGSQQYSKEEEHLILNPADYIRERNSSTNIIYINDSSQEILNTPSTTFDNLTNGMQIPSGTKITLDNYDWAFIPYNIRLLSKDEEIKFMSLLAKSVGQTFDEFIKLDIKEVWKNKNLPMKNAIVKCIKNFNGKPINAASMTLYSGPWEKWRRDGEIGCLYLGDYNAKKNYDKLEKAYKDVLGRVGIVQIPHHGSFEYFNDRLIKDGRLAVISVSMPNKKIKPQNTINRILELNGVPLITGYRGDVPIYALRIFCSSCCFLAAPYIDSHYFWH